MSRKFITFIVVSCLSLLMSSAVFAADAAIKLVGYSPWQVEGLELEAGRAAPLTVIGVGQPVYMKSEYEGTYSWSLTAPDGSAAVLSSTTEREIHLIPDTIGSYVVALDFTDSEGNASSDEITVTGANYVGVGGIGGAALSAGQCKTCHSAKVTEWEQTGHASMLQRGLDGFILEDGAYPEECLQCHTVGYDTQADNGGFDDVAKEVGWTFPDTLMPGNYDSLVANYPALAQLANIQCENCHGPGSEHNGDKSKIAVSYDAGVCSYCHWDEETGQAPPEWENSKHGKELDPSEYFTGSTKCVGCHTAEGFFQQNVDQVEVTADYKTPHGQTCVVCHDPHEQTVEHQLRVVSDMAYLDADTGEPKYSTTGEPTQACTVCHHFRPGRDFPGTVPHHSHQTEMLNNVAGWMNPDKTMPATNAHGTLIAERCVVCHMADGVGEKANIVGGHTFKMHAVADTINNLSADVYLTEACVGCHTGIGENFDIDGVQTKVTLMLNELFDRLPKATGGRLAGFPAYDSTDFKDGYISEDQLTAAFNWYIVDYDGSKGVHNPGMSVALLTDALERVPATAECASCDINGDGKLGISDAVKLILLGAEDNTQACIDRNGDFVYDVRDVIKLITDIWSGSCGGTMLAGVGGVELINFQMELTAEQIQAVQSVIEQLELTSEQAAAFQVALFGDGSGRTGLPRAFSLGQNAPNPFNPSTTIKFAVPEGKAGPVTLKVYDVRGRLVRSLVDGFKEAGDYTVFWGGIDENGQNVSSGVYFYRMIAGDFTQTRKMVMLK